MKIIIIGAGKVGRNLTESLSQKHDVTVIDTNRTVIEDLANVCDIMGVCGNGANYEVQKEAGSADADLLIACAPADEINILACLVAKKLGTGHMIARVRDPEYEQQLRIMRDDLGLSMVINPEKAAAREISRVLRFPTALKLETFSKGRVELLEYMIKPESPLAGTKLSELASSVRAKVLICAVERGQNVYIPSGDFQLECGDIVYLTASPSELKAFFSHIGALRSGVKDVMIVGASNICHYLARELCESGIKVKVIDNDAGRCRRMSERFPRALVIQGDASDIELLGEEGIDQSDAFVALTGMDEANIILSMYAIRKGVSKVVTKINRRSFSDLVSHSTMADTIVSTSAVTSERILQYVRSIHAASASGIKTLHRIVGGRVEAVEFSVGSDSGLTGKPLSGLDLRSDLLIAGIVRRDGSMIIPNGSDVLEDDDSVIVVTTDNSLSALSDIVR